MPDFLNDAQRDIQRRAHSLGRQVASLNTDSLEAHQIESETRALSKQAGIYLLTQPAEFGGTAGTSLDLTIAREALGACGVSHLPGFFGPMPGLLAQASEHVRNKFLGPYLAGEAKGGFGFTEPPDAERHTWARDEGDHLVVNGHKSYVTGGSHADFINTLVELENVGPAMVLIETNSPGVQIIRRFGSVDGTQHASFSFTDVHVPREHLIGEAGAGMKRALDQVNAVRMAIAADSLGLCSFVCDVVAEHVEQGRSSEIDAGSDQAVRVQFGRMRSQSYGVRSAVYRTARLVDAGENAVNEVMASKVLATETLNLLVDLAIQIIGGEALVDSHPLASLFRRARATRLAEGPTDVLHANIARGYLDLHLGRI
ncbi:MAG: acyl-CoA dehydrogenase family protein [Actinomycetota bacterium]|nr:acyl-CoA dehydrogenase family protein [Actinomycetota bacterium]